MTLLTEEEEILVSDDRNVILTNQRIGQSTKDWGSDSKIHLFLENISAVEMKAQSVPVLLVLGIVFLTIGVYIFLQNGANSQHAFLLIGVGLVSILAWIQTKRRVIKVSSCGGPALSIDVKRMSPEKSEEFIDRVQQLKAARVRYLFKLTV